MRQLLTRYNPRYLATVIYMLQASEYETHQYLSWFHRTHDFNAVARRRSLVRTNKAKLLLIGLTLTAITLLAAFIYVAVRAYSTDDILLCLLAIIGLVLLPWILAYGIIVPLLIGREFVQKPKERLITQAARQKLSSHPGFKIAVAGSYGKTTAKEALLTVLQEGKKVAATPGNMNTMIGTSRFIQSLDGDEDVIIFELGESRVGDVAELCELTQPDMGVITGINEAHLETFKTIERTIDTIFELEGFLGEKPLYKNGESPLVAKRVSSDDPLLYSQSGVDGWQVSDDAVSIHGVSFTARKDNSVIWAEAGLMGQHNIGILMVAITIASELGLENSQIVEGLKRVVPFEHRMQPRLVHEAWIIDDTYNGNIDGVKAGLKLLGQLEAKRRVYVSPGLVEQGNKTEQIHEEMGSAIAKVADTVILMNNSVVDYIASGLSQAGFRGQLTIIDDPLEFYTNIEQFVVPGDVVLMQNDWTDNYA